MTINIVVFVLNHFVPYIGGIWERNCSELIFVKFPRLKFSLKFILKFRFG
jgi:hypothetical protein